jgi:hypothetical protein
VAELTIVLKVAVEPREDGLAPDETLPRGTATAQVLRDGGEDGEGDRTAVILLRIER